MIGERMGSNLASASCHLRSGADPSMRFLQADGAQLYSYRC